MWVDIIPQLIPLQVFNVSLKEGSTKALTEEVIKVTNQHFAGLDFQYFVSEPHIMATSSIHASQGYT
uniref:Uncharacterized protein n=1 Tax=Anguilla anguilla TaxID=7936 RepID=A0A0E9T3Y6_ANGAN